MANVETEAKAAEVICLKWKSAKSAPGQRCQVQGRVHADMIMSFLSIRKHPAGYLSSALLHQTPWLSYGERMG